jgi:hypothetical protein
MYAASSDLRVARLARLPKSTFGEAHDNNAGPEFVGLPTTTVC